MTKEEKNHIKKLESMIDERDEYIKYIKESARETFKYWIEKDERNNIIIHDYKDIIYNTFLDMSRLLDRDIVDAVIDSCIGPYFIFRDRIKEMIDYDQTVNRLKNYEEYKEIEKEKSNEKFLDEYIRKTEYSDIFEGHDSDYEDFEDYNDFKNRELMIKKIMKEKGCPWPPIYMSCKKGRLPVFVKEK